MLAFGRTDDSNEFEILGRVSGTEAETRPDPENDQQNMIGVEPLILGKGDRLFNRLLIASDQTYLIQYFKKM